MDEEGCNVDRRERMIMRKNMARVGPPHHQWLVIIRELSFLFYYFFFIRVSQSINLDIFAFQWRRDLERGKIKRLMQFNGCSDY